MQKLIEVIKLVATKYKDEVNVILSGDMLTLEYMYLINDELDVYKTIQETEFEDKLSIKIYPEKTTKVITIDELEDIFLILNKQICRKDHTLDEIKIIKEKYVSGTRIELLKMYDLFSPPPKTTGTIIGVDDTGHIMMKWDNSSTLSLVIGTDLFRVISIPRTTEEIQQIKEKYKIGIKIKMNRLSNRQIAKKGLLGNVEQVDEFGNIVVRYKTLGTVTLIEGLDDFEIWEE